MTQAFEPGIDILCAGIPRSGTTMLYRALCGLKPASTTPQPQTGPIRKTHSFEPARFTGIRAAVFVFGLPVPSVISTRLNRWGAAHFANCGAAHRDPDTTDIFREDALNYEAMFDAWMQRQPFDLVAVRYDRMHDHQAAIAEVLGTPFTLPPRRKRRTRLDAVDPADLDAARQTYRRLTRKVRKAPDLSIWRA